MYLPYLSATSSMSVFTQGQFLHKFFRDWFPNQGYRTQSAQVSYSSGKKR